MHSLTTFVAVAVVVSLTPGPATVTVIRTAARDGRRPAIAAIGGNSVGVLLWAVLSAVGVSSLVLASQVAYDVLKLSGAVVLVVLGLRSLFAGRHRLAVEAALLSSTPRSTPSLAAGWQAGLLTGVANPKLAVFFVALFPQFLDPARPVLPYALVMAAVVVMVDLVWFTTLAVLVDRAGSLLRPGVQILLERVCGTVMVALGLRLGLDGA